MVLSRCVFPLVSVCLYSGRFRFGFYMWEKEESSRKRQWEAGFLVLGEQIHIRGGEEKEEEEEEVRTNKATITRREEKREGEEREKERSVESFHNNPPPQYISSAATATCLNKPQSVCAELRAESRTAQPPPPPPSFFHEVER